MLGHFELIASSMTISQHLTWLSHGDPSIQISAPTATELRPAVQLLLADASTPESFEQVDALLQAAELGEISLAGVFVARYVGVSGPLLGAVMAICQPDGTAHVWPPAVSPIAPSALALELAVTCREWVRQSGARLAQCLTAIDNHLAQRLLEQAGYEPLTQLVCWHHDLDDIPVTSWPGPCSCREYTASNAARFIAVIQQTYVGSQDCVQLQGRRSAEDSLTAHELVARAESRSWKLYHQGDEDIGVVLCADHCDQRMWELLYLGVVPKFRHRRFGLALLTHTLHTARAAGAEGLFLAADSANKAAANLYERSGFAVGFRQQIHVWFPPAPVGS